MDMAWMAAALAAATATIVKIAVIGGLLLVVLQLAESMKRD